MNDSRTPETLSGCRAEARRLLKHLRGADAELARAAARRFVRLRSLASGDIDGLLVSRERVKLKHALAVVAEEQGYPSWLALRRALEGRAARLAADVPSFHTHRLDSMLNRWFVDHAEALASLRAEGGYLLPFGAQFFVTESEGVLALGLDPDDPDWAAIGFDLARPLDRAAHARLCAKRRAAIASGVGAPSEPRSRA